MGSFALVVDDTESYRIVLRGFLEQGGFTVVEAEDGLQALECLGKQSFDLILTDLTMPRLDGWGFVEAARKLPHASEVPIVVISALGEEEALDRAFAAGATSHVQKPFTAAELQRVVSRFLA